jgi:hypothetical protein
MTEQVRHETTDEAGADGAGTRHRSANLLMNDDFPPHIVLDSSETLMEFLAEGAAGDELRRWFVQNVVEDVLERRAATGPRADEERIEAAIHCDKWGVWRETWVAGEKSGWERELFNDRQQAGNWAAQLNLGGGKARVYSVRPWIKACVKGDVGAEDDR